MGLPSNCSVNRVGKEQLMDSMEMKTLQETSRVVEKMADFAGSVILQLM